MKKLFIKGFMAVALFAVVGLVSSCKDYSDEIMAEYRGQNAVLMAQIEELTLKHNQDLVEAKEERDRIESELNAHIANAEERYVTKTELETVKAELEAAKAELKSQYEAADAAVKAELQGQIDGITAQLGTITAQLGTINTEIENLKSQIQTAITRLSELTATVTTLEERITKLEGLNDRITALENELGKYATKEQLGNELGKYATKEQLDELKEVINDLASCGCNLKNLATLTDLANLRNQVEADSIRIDVLQKTIENLKLTSDCDSIASLLSELEAKHANDIENIKAEMATISGQIDECLEQAKAYTDAAVEALKDEIVNDIEDLLNKVSLDIDDLKGRVSDLETKVQKNAGDIQVLMQDIQGLKEAMKNHISSIILQGAYSPVVGYFNMPLGVKSNILAAYKGEFVNGQDEVDFPFAMSENMLDGQINPLYALKKSLGGGETITELGGNYAGKLYLTINPAEVSLDGVDFSVVNSQDDVAPVKLSTPIRTSDVLKFGYTRAGTAVYEATATITDVNKTSLNFNIEDYKDTFSDLMSGNVNLSNIANTLSSSINELAEANAVRATWTDALGEHTVYSDFDIAAIAVKPLSFSFMYGQEISSIPGITRVNNAIDNVINRINLDFSIVNFDDIKFKLNKLDLDESKFVVSIDTTIVVEGQKITVYEEGESTGLYIDVEGTRYPIVVDDDVVVNVEGKSIVFTYTNKDLAKEILGIENTVNGQFAEIENLIAEVNSMLAQLRETEDKVNQSIDAAKDKISSQLDKYLDKLNNKLCNIINSFNDKLQPAMFVKTTDGFGVLSQVKSMPTVISNGAVLVPTTYTAELLAPVCKKWVAITAVDGSTNDLAAVNSGDLNKVLDGDVRTVEFNGESGKTYEVTYAALDYSGIVSTVKYYVTVK